MCEENIDTLILWYIYDQKFLVTCIRTWKVVREPTATLVWGEKEKKEKRLKKD